MQVFTGNTHMASDDSIRFFILLNSLFIWVCSSAKENKEQEPKDENKGGCPSYEEELLIDLTGEENDHRKLTQKYEAPIDVSKNQFQSSFEFNEPRVEWNIANSSSNIVVMKRLTES